VGDCEVVVGRELTKAHEELVRGPISGVIGKLTAELGEFTVVVDVGLSPKLRVNPPPSQFDLAAEFGELTADATLSRRRAVATLARRHGMAPNAVYAAIEAAKKSG
jgi:16S rRNA C1402 (ribose-2'-O) methylase RsmI